MIGTKLYPVTQVRTGYGKGQCTEAAIASLIGCTLEDVPDLWTGAPDGSTEEEHQPYENRVRLWNWLKREHGVMLCAVRLLENTEAQAAYDRALQLFVEPKDAVWAEYHYLVGPNPDGVNHVIVARRGVPVWDPNPSRRGITAVRWVEWLVPLHLLPEDVQTFPAAEWLEPQTAGT